MLYLFGLVSLVLLAWAMLTIIGGEKKRLEYQRMHEARAQADAKAGSTNDGEIWLK